MHLGSDVTRQEFECVLSSSTAFAEDKLRVSMENGKQWMVVPSSAQASPFRPQRRCPGVSLHSRISTGRLKPNFSNSFRLGWLCPKTNPGSLSIRKEGA